MVGCRGSNWRVRRVLGLVACYLRVLPPVLPHLFLVFACQYKIFEGSRVSRVLAVPECQGSIVTLVDHLPQERERNLGQILPYKIRWGTDF